MSAKNRNNVIPILGVPGYPVSAALTVDIFVEPLIASGWDAVRWNCPKWKPRSRARSPRRPVTTISSASRWDAWAENYWPRRWRAGRGSSPRSSARTGCFFLPRGEQGAEAGQQVKVKLYRSQSELDKTIFCIGSHDVILDLLAQFLAEHDRRFVSANVGSQGGLIALKRGEAHLAGSHLLDPATGEYNVAALRDYLPGCPSDWLRLSTASRD